MYSWFVTVIILFVKLGIFHANQTFMCFDPNAEIMLRFLLWSMSKSSSNFWTDRSKEMLLCYLSRGMGFPTMWYVRPAKPQISLRIRAVWSEPLLVAWIFYECKATDRKPFGVSKLKRRLHRLVWVYNCQNATLLEITCHGSFTGPRSAVGNVSGYRCVSDCNSRGREFDPGPVPYFRDWSWNNFYGHSTPFRWFIQEGLLSVTNESMCTITG